jgi:hypothetical protein
MKDPNDVLIDAGERKHQIREQIKELKQTERPAQEASTHATGAAETVIGLGVFEPASETSPLMTLIKPFLPLISLITLIFSQGIVKAAAKW